MRLLVHLVLVDADDHLVLALDRLLEAEGRLLDLALRVAALDRRDHAAHRVDAPEVLERLGLELVRQLLDEPRAAERVGHVRDARSRAR